MERTHSKLEGYQVKGYQLDLIHEQAYILLRDQNGESECLISAQDVPHLGLGPVELYKAAWLVGVDQGRSGDVTPANMKDKFREIELAFQTSQKIEPMAP